MTKTNFKTKAKLLAAVAVVAALGGACTKEMAPDPTTIRLMRNINATATMPQQSADKAYLHTSDRKVFWQPNDTISINGTAIRTHSIDPNDSTKAEFTGTIGAYTHGGKDCYWAVYPTSLRSTSSASGLVVDIPLYQTFDKAEQPLSGTTYMAAHTDANPSSYYLGFEMKNLVTVLRLRLKSSTNGKRLDRIVFTHSTTNLSGMSGTISDPAAPMSLGSGSNGLIVDCKNGLNDYIELSSSDFTDVYVALPPLTSGELVMRLYDKDGNHTIRTHSVSTLNRNTVYTSTMNPVAFEKTEKTISGSYNTELVFAPGNLMYVAANRTWQFARKQYLRIGNAAGNTTAEAYRATQADTIDLFGWGTSGWNNGNVFYQPYDATFNSQAYPATVGMGYGPTDGSDYNYSLTGTYANADWGVYNNIYNPVTGSTDAKGTWRTPTKYEYIYLIGKRTASTVNGTPNARYTLAAINTDGDSIQGLILFPDYYSGGTPAGVTWGNINCGTAWNTVTLCTSAGWTALENAGCVFLPVTGTRTRNSVSGNYNGLGYWSSTSVLTMDGVRAHRVSTGTSKSLSYAEDKAFATRANGYAVRLVKEN
ncbi:MAG: hypothetical protein J5605_00265 [Bacteroidales bacterium]|nr:hypothetical protein [Bacteroidales bacterium]